jgi:hypothetical protein
MKPGMQRDLLVAFWLLFDEFEIGDDGSRRPQPSATERSGPAPAPKDAAGVRSSANRKSTRPV